MPQNRIWAKNHLSVLSCNSTTAYLIATSFSILESSWIGLYNKIKYNNFAKGPYHPLSDLYSALNRNNAKIGKILKIGQLLAPITFFLEDGQSLLFIVPKSPIFPLFKMIFHILRSFRGGNIFEYQNGHFSTFLKPSLATVARQPCYHSNHK